MEVHHHPHVGKKKFKEYFLEFLMIFLAVTMGFFAESLREYRVNKEIEKRNIESFITNVQNDSANLAISIQQNEYKIKLIDSMAVIPGNFTDTVFQKKFFYYVLQLNYYDDYNPDESAFLQMQSSGTLRLIKQQNIVDSILEYQGFNQSIRKQQEAMNNSLVQSIENIIQVTDLRALVNHSPLKLNGNIREIQNYINHQIGEGKQAETYIKLLNTQLIHVSTLLPFLKKEYGIK